MTTRVSREELCADCDGEEDAGCAEVFETMCGGGCVACSGTSCASAEPENARVAAAAARSNELVRMNAASEEIPVWLQSSSSRPNAQ